MGDAASFPTQMGYMTGVTRKAYIAQAITDGVLPADAQRLPRVASLKASDDPADPIQFWQLYSILGQDRIVQIVGRFYQRVFADEDWFRAPFIRVGDLHHHIATQASMWIDVMGGGPYYHGAEFRLSFHHTHNAHQLMNAEGAARWTTLMLQTLETSQDLMTDDSRVRPSINTFLTHFIGKYAQDFDFETPVTFGPTNAAVAKS